MQLQQTLTEKDELQALVSRLAAENQQLRGDKGKLQVEVNMTRQIVRSLSDQMLKCQPEDLRIGDYVQVDRSRRGLVLWIGRPHWDPAQDGEIWLGVALVVGKGSCDGAIRGKRYFRCEASRGVFVRGLVIVGKLPTKLLPQQETPDMTRFRERIQARQPSAIETIVSYKCKPGPSEVLVSGSWDDFSSETVVPWRRLRSGREIWAVRVPLVVGEHFYRFKVDEQ